jgi:hypothetical protein
MPSDEKIMYDHSEGKAPADPAPEHKSHLTETLDDAMQTVVKPFVRDRPDAEELEEQREAQDEEARE